MTPEELFEQVKFDWQSHDDWQFADRDAERRYFLLAGMEAGRRQAVDIEGNRREQLQSSITA